MDNYMIFRLFRNNKKNVPCGQPAAENDHNIIEISESINDAFCGLILGIQSKIDQDMSAFEKKVLAKIRHYLSRPDDQHHLIPRLPRIIPQLMSSLKKEEDSIAFIVDLVKKDAALVSEVIRLANSPYYRVNCKINSIERAVSIIGINGLKELVVRACLRPLLDLHSGHFVRMSGLLLWDYGERCALVANCLAAKSYTDQFHAYLSGIIQYTGYIVVLKIIDQCFTGEESPNSVAFYKNLAKLVSHMTYSIGKEWAFPDEVISLLKCQADGSIINNFEDDSAKNLFVACAVAKESVLLKKRIIAQSSMAAVLPTSLDCMSFTNKSKNSN